MPRTFGTGRNDANTKRYNLRPQLESGKSKRTGRPLGDAWLQAKWPELLDAHYLCRIPGPSATHLLRILREMSNVETEVKPESITLM